MMVQSLARYIPLKKHSRSIYIHSDSQNYLSLGQGQTIYKLTNKQKFKLIHKAVQIIWHAQLNSLYYIH